MYQNIMLFRRGENFQGFIFQVDKALEKEATGIDLKKKQIRVKRFKTVILKNAVLQSQRSIGSNDQNTANLKEQWSGIF